MTMLLHRRNCKESGGASEVVEVAASHPLSRSEVVFHDGRSLGKKRKKGYLEKRKKKKSIPRWKVTKWKKERRNSERRRGRNGSMTTKRKKNITRRAKCGATKKRIRDPVSIAIPSPSMGRMMR